MRGHEHLISMRMQGYAPGMVWLDVDSPKLPMVDDWHIVSPQHAHLQLQPNDRVATIDLRCVVGLMVFVDGRSAKRVTETRDACIRAGATRVIAYAADHLSDTGGQFHG